MYGSAPISNDRYLQFSFYSRTAIATAVASAAVVVVVVVVVVCFSKIPFSLRFAVFSLAHFDRSAFAQNFDVHCAPLPPFIPHPPASHTIFVNIRAFCALCPLRFSHFRNY